MNKLLTKFIYHLTMIMSRKMIAAKYGGGFWRRFKRGSDRRFAEILPETPDIGKSVFSFNYAYAPAYAAWYKTMRALGLDAAAADELMWLMNEKMLLTVPKPLLHMVGKSYLNSFRRKAAAHEARQKNGLHPFDWEIAFRDIDSNSFEIDITKCGFVAFAKKFGAEGMLPGICGVDYMISHYMGNGFRRTKTLGFGDGCCDCHYELTGKCPLRAGEGQK